MTDECFRAVVCCTTDIQSVPGCGDANFLVNINNILQQQTPQSMENVEGHPCDVSPSRHTWLSVLLHGLHSPAPTVVDADAVPRNPGYRPQRPQ